MRNSALALVSASLLAVAFAAYGSEPPALHESHVDLSVTDGETKATANVDGDTSLAVTYPATEPIDDVALACGLVYADDGSDAEVTVEVANVVLRACP